MISAHFGCLVSHVLRRPNPVPWLANFAFLYPATDLEGFQIKSTVPAITQPQMIVGWWMIVEVRDDSTIAKQLVPKRWSVLIAIDRRETRDPKPPRAPEAFGAQASRPGAPISGNESSRIYRPWPTGQTAQASIGKRRHNGGKACTSLREIPNDPIAKRIIKHSTG